MCYGFVPVENPTSFVLKSPQKILHKIRPYSHSLAISLTKKLECGVRIKFCIFLETPAQPKTNEVRTTYACTKTLNGFDSRFLPQKKNRNAIRL